MARKDESGQDTWESTEGEKTDSCTIITPESNKLLKPYPPDQMEFYTVGPIINSPANDAPDCLVATSQEVQLKP